MAEQNGHLRARLARYSLLRNLLEDDAASAYRDAGNAQLSATPGDAAPGTPNIFLDYRNLSSRLTEAGISAETRLQVLHLYLVGEYVKQNPAEAQRKMENTPHFRESAEAAAHLPALVERILQGMDVQLPQVMEETTPFDQFANAVAQRYAAVMRLKTTGSHNL